MEVHRTIPHGEHRVLMLEDAIKPGNRIFEIRDRTGGRLGFTGEEIESLCEWWAAESTRTVGAKDDDIRELRCLDCRGLEWEWRCGAFDYHARYEPGSGSWVLEQFDSSISPPFAAHRDESECVSLTDALLWSVDAACQLRRTRC